MGLLFKMGFFIKITFANSRMGLLFKMDFFVKITFANSRMELLLEMVWGSLSRVSPLAFFSRYCSTTGLCSLLPKLYVLITEYSNGHALTIDCLISTRNLCMNLTVGTVMAALPISVSSGF